MRFKARLAALLLLLTFLTGVAFIQLFASVGGNSPRWFPVVGLSPTRRPTRSIHTTPNFFVNLSSSAFALGAVHDERHGNMGGAAVRVLLLARPAQRFRCRFANGTVVESGKPYEMAENHGRSFGVFFANCPIPLNETVDDTIEVMTTNVGASWSDVPIIYNALESIEESSYEHDLTVCLPFLYGNRYSGKEFVEFIELNRILGVQHFVAYVGETDIAKSLKKAASYYENLGILTLNRLEIPVSPSRIWYHGQLIAITDCLYRNIGVSRFVAFHDLDEFMIPQNLTSTEGLAPVIDALQELFLDNVASICLTTQYMIPRHKGELRTLYNTVAAQRVSTKLSKCVVRPEMVFEQGIHHTSRVIQNHFKSIHGDPNVLRLYHFKQTTDYHKEDTTVVVNYGERLTRRYKEVVKKIGL